MDVIVVTTITLLVIGLAVTTGVVVLVDKGLEAELEVEGELVDDEVADVGDGGTMTVLVEVRVTGGRLLVAEADCDVTRVAVELIAHPTSRHA